MKEDAGAAPVGASVGSRMQRQGQPGGEDGSHEERTRWASRDEKHGVQRSRRGGAPG